MYEGIKRSWLSFWVSSLLFRTCAGCVFITVYKQTHRTRRPTFFRAFHIEREKVTCLHRCFTKAWVSSVDVFLPLSPLPSFLIWLTDDWFLHPRSKAQVRCSFCVRVLLVCMFILEPKKWKKKENCVGLFVEQSLAVHNRCTIISVNVCAHITRLALPTLLMYVERLSLFSLFLVFKLSGTYLRREQQQKSCHVILKGSCGVTEEYLYIFWKSAECCCIPKVLLPPLPPTHPHVAFTCQPILYEMSLGNFMGM